MTFDPEAVRAFEHAGWEKAARVYELSFGVASRQFVPDLLDVARVRRGIRALDLCCGPGIVTGAIAARGASATGLDFSAAMLARARARHGQAIHFELGDAEAPPFNNKRFDSVVSNFGIHHVPRPERALAAAHRMLVAGGHCAFTVWADPSRNIAWKLVFDAVRQVGDPSRSAAPPPGGGFASAEDCVRALKAAGFIDVETKALSGTWHQPDGAGLLAALRNGTARMAALINAQDPALLPAVSTAIDTAAAPYRDESGIAVPIAAILAWGVRS
jgi:SAM-dependent methyltransferase